MLNYSDFYAQVYKSVQFLFLLQGPHWDIIEARLYTQWGLSMRLLCIHSEAQDEAGWGSSVHTVRP